MLRGELGPVLAGEAGRRVRVERQVERTGTERVGQLHAGAGGKIERPEQVEPGAVGRVPSDLELGSHRREAHLAPGGVDGGAHARVHLLPRLVEELRGDGAVRLARPDGGDGAERAQVGEPGGGAGDLAGRLCVEPGRHGGVARGAEPADERGVEHRLRGPQLEPVDVERIGDAGGDGNPELVEVQRLSGDPGVAADGGQQVGPALPHPRLRGARVELRDGGVDALAPAKRDRLEQRQRPLGGGPLLRGRPGRGSDQQRQRDQRTAHGSGLSSCLRGGRAPRGDTCRPALRRPARP